MPEMVLIPRDTLERLEIIHTRYACNIDIWNSQTKTSSMYPYLANDGRAISTALGRITPMSYPLEPIDWGPKANTEAQPNSGDGRSSAPANQPAVTS